MEKFGFSDDEEEDIVLSAAEMKKKLEAAGATVELK